MGTNVLICVTGFDISYIQCRPRWPSVPAHPFCHKAEILRSKCGHISVVWCPWLFPVKQILRCLLLDFWQCTQLAVGLPMSCWGIARLAVSVFVVVLVGAKLLATCNVFFEKINPLAALSDHSKNAANDFPNMWSKTKHKLVLFYTTWVKKKQLFRKPC